MKSGYNIGIEATADVKVEKIGKGTKPTFASPPLPKQNPALPHVVIMSTGGTIASRVDYRTGAVRSAMSASDLYGVVPELADVARVDTEIVFSIYSENMTPQNWTELAQTVAKRIEQGVDGIVIAHGTDTMAYTSAALSFALQNLPVPVILVGAQRSSDRPSSDAATNLIGAVKAAGEAPFAEVGLAMHETVSDTAIVIHQGTKVRKCHTSRRDTFKSINGFPIAKVQNLQVTMQTRQLPEARPQTQTGCKTELQRQSSTWSNSIRVLTQQSSTSTLNKASRAFCLKAQVWAMLASSVLMQSNAPQPRVWWLRWLPSASGDA